MRSFYAWFQDQVYRAFGGGTVTIPEGTFYLDGCIKISGGATGVVIQGAGIDKTIIKLSSKASVALMGMYILNADNITIRDLTFDCRDVSPAYGPIRFSGCSTCVVERCAVLGGQTFALGFESTCATITVTDCEFGGLTDLGAGKGRGLHLQTGTNGCTVSGIRAYDANLRHLVCCEDNIESATLSDIQTEQAHDFAAVDVHGKLEGNASQGSITIDSCAGRLNIGNDTHLNGSHATVTNHNGQGKSINVYPNSVLRYQSLTNATVVDLSGGTATITNMGGAG